jgi:tetratricopeptide (TPR) repeat protein
MSIFMKRRIAEQLYEDGFALYREHRYEQALIELSRAADTFRKLDARGHPFSHPLSNGVTGHANALALAGRCHQQLGDIEKAIICFETSLINAKFERPKPFQDFVAAVRQDMLACYARVVEKSGPLTRQDVLVKDLPIDPSYRFPFSLDKEAIPFARLYELAPERYPQLGDFFLGAREKDAALRRAGKGADDTRMRKAVFTIWLILGSLWAVYALMAVRVLSSR